MASFHIPLELWEKFASHLSEQRQDLLNLRFVSPESSAAAATFLFESICLRMDPQSFQQLTDISRHEILNRCVKVIEYDCSVYEKFECDDGTCPHQVGISERKSALDDTLKKFTNLKELKIVANKIVKVLVCRPVNHPGLFDYRSDISLKVFLLSALSNSTQPLHIHACIFPKANWGMESWAVEGQQKGLWCKLEGLTVQEFYDCKIRPLCRDEGPEIPGLDSILKASVSLKHLRLHRIAPISKVISRESHWEFLNSLHLDYLVVSKKLLKAVLSKHKGSLRHLKLTHVKFCEVKNKSWSNFLRFLREEMCFESFQVDGDFEWVIENEDWQLRELEYDFGGGEKDESRCAAYVMKEIDFLCPSKFLPLESKMQ